MRRTLKTLSILSILTVFAPGCAMAKGAAPPMGPGVGTTDAGYALDGANVSAESEAVVVSESRGIGSIRGLFKQKRADDRRSTDVMAAAPAEPAPMPDPVVNAPGPAVPEEASSGEPEPALADDPQAHGRQIIYTAMLQIGVFDLQLATQKAETLPEKYGGYVQSMSSGSLVLRIPGPRLREAMTELGSFGNVEARSLSSQDVTDEYVDLETRIRVLRETQAQLIELLQKANSVEEALKVREALDQITMQLEQAIGRLRQLENSVAFSTLTLTLIERGPHQPVPTSNDPFPWVDALGVEATEWK